MNETTNAHMIDDHETTRTHALRTIDAQRTLLTDALHALRHDRLAVADEFIDRALTALDRESEYLKGRNK